MYLLPTFVSSFSPPSRLYGINIWSTDFYIMCVCKASKYKTFIPYISIFLYPFHQSSIKKIAVTQQQSRKERETKKWMLDTRMLCINKKQELTKGCLWHEKNGRKENDRAKKVKGKEFSCPLKLGNNHKIQKKLLNYTLDHIESILKLCFFLLHFIARRVERNVWIWNV